jgi:uncharacterized protein
MSGDIKEYGLNTRIFIIPYDDNYVIYAPLIQFAFIGNGATVNYLYNLNHKIKEVGKEKKELNNFLINNGLLTVNSNAIRKKKLIKKNEDTVFSPTDLTLFLTSKCSLKCIYCYASSKKENAVNMDMDAAKASIDMIVSNALSLGKKRIVLNYHGGGEPTQYWTGILKTFEYAKKLAIKNNLELNSYIATNGTIGVVKMKWIAENLNGASISLDGNKFSHETQRPFFNGKSSFKTVTRSIRYFDKVRFPYGIRMTVTNKTIHKLPQSIFYLFMNFRPSNVQVEPVYNLGRALSENLHIPAKDFISSFREAKFIAEKLNGNILFSAARQDLITNSFCQCCGNGFCLTGKGFVSSCFEVFENDAPYAEKFIFGSFNNQHGTFNLNLDVLKNIQKEMKSEKKKCDNCFCLFHCAGDCFYKKQHNDISGKRMNSERCEITRALVLDQILNKIISSGGLYWKGCVESRE